MSLAARERSWWWRTRPDGRRRPTWLLLASLGFGLAWWFKPAGEPGARGGAPLAADAAATPAREAPARETSGWPSPGGAGEVTTDPMVEVWKELLAEASAPPPDEALDEAGVEHVPVAEVPGAIVHWRGPSTAGRATSNPSATPALRTGSRIPVWFLDTVRSDDTQPQVHLAIAATVPTADGGFLSPPARLEARLVGRTGNRLRFEVEALQQPDGTTVPMEGVLMDPEDGTRGVQGWWVPPGVGATLAGFASDAWGVLADAARSETGTRLGLSEDGGLVGGPASAGDSLVLAALEATDPALRSRLFQSIPPGSPRGHLEIRAGARADLLVLEPKAPPAAIPELPSP